jgi:two-component system, chemotaxis family, chemotaxis protein CheY
MTTKVLLVDDSGLARRSTRRILEGAGYVVVEAEDGISALERYFVEKPDAVVLDLVMKGMYGLDVLVRLREMDPGVRVIVLSADIQTSSRDLVQNAGAAGFLSKPVDGPRLLAMLESVLGGTF